MEFLLIASTHFLALLSPGPDFFLIMQAAVRLPVRYSLSLCLGIAIANGVYLVLAVLGLELAKEASNTIALLKYTGAGYLIFLGIMLLRAPLQSFDNTDARGARNFIMAKSHPRQFLVGFTSAIVNPKNAIFYLALFTVMVSPNTQVFTKALYALWMMVIVFVWDCSLVLVLGNGKVKKWFGRSVFYVEKVAGVMLTLFGVMLPFS